ncbi:MAG TPA: glycoside hydrolase family 36 protein [Solirubrobacteraceae bacterium]
MTWLPRILGALRLDDLADQPGNVVPFAVRAETEIGWLPPTIEERGAHSWRLRAGSPQGLEATWMVTEYADTRAVECSGELRNVGRETVVGIRELWTLDARVGLPERWGEPWVRCVNGVRFLPSHFPPDDYRYVDRQLLRTPQVYTPVGGSALEDGRSSGRDLPCLILASAPAGRGFALFYEWSGLWTLGVTQDPTPAGGSWPWPIQLGAAIWGLSIDLRPGERLPFANLAIAGFDGGLSEGGNALRRHVARHVAPSLGGEPVQPPTSFNHYFAFVNDFTAAKLEPAVDAAAACGLEYFVVDAGWFRGGFRRGIGNWGEADPAKFPDGMPAFARHVGQRGLRFGTWFEPEFAHVSSTLFAEHPEWFLRGPHTSPWATPTDVHYPDGVRMTDVFDLGENFALMDFGLAEVQQWWMDRIIEAYERWDVRWILWDFNQPPRPYWDHEAPVGRVGLRQVGHVEGLYRVLDEVMRACPDLLIEQCASGGFRIDLGTVRRGHTFWMNDHTTHSDVVRALQHGLNEVLPGIYANTNLAQGRFDYAEYDFLSHGGGSFGFSGRLWEASGAELERLHDFVTRFKGYRHLLADDYERSTGNPQSASEYAHAVWTDGGASVEMTFNADRRGSAELRHTGPPAVEAGR